MEIPKIKFNRYFLIEDGFDLSSQFAEIIERKITSKYPICKIEFELEELIAKDKSNDAETYFRNIEIVVKRKLDILIESKRYIPLVNDNDLHIAFFELMKDEYPTLICDLKDGIAQNYFGSKIENIIEKNTISEIEGKLKQNEKNILNPNYTKIDLYSKKSDNSENWRNSIISFYITKEELNDLSNNMDFVCKEPNVIRELQHRFTYQSHILPTPILVKRVLPAITKRIYRLITNGQINDIHELDFGLHNYYVGLG